MSVIVIAAVLAIALPVASAEIHDAARSGDLETVTALLEADPELLDARDDNGMTALHWAARGVHAEVVIFLVKRGADVTVRDDNQVIPLHSLAYRGAAELVALVAVSGADVDAQIPSGTAPIHFAIQGGHAVTVNRLLALEADPDLSDALGNTPLLLASSYGLEDVVSVLLAAGAAVDHRNTRGDTPLTVAHREGHGAIVQLLVDNGADPALTEELRIPDGPYLGQKPPAGAPVVFAPRIVSTEQAQLNAVFSPDGREFYFTQRRPGGSTIMVMRMEGTGWSRPAPAVFSGRYSDVDHFMTGDGRRMFFCSNRPIEPTAETKPDADIWVSYRSDETWGEAQHLGPIVNSKENDYYPTLAEDGTLYFSSQREGGLGENDIYRSSFINGAFTAPDNLGPSVNTRFREFDPFVAPDHSYLIFASERPGGQGGADLYISFRDPDGSWSEARNMGPGVNSGDADFTPMLSPDGAYLFLTSRRGGSSDIYWVKARVIEELRPEGSPLSPGSPISARP